MPVGIDLGTTYSCIADNGNVIPINGCRTTPSVVKYGPNAKAECVGADAEKYIGDPSNTVACHTKRLIGLRPDEAETDFPIPLLNVEGAPEPLLKLRDCTVAPQTVASHVLRHLARGAAEVLGHPVKDAVITVPAYFADARRCATIDAARKAGVNVIRLINEPTAAAYAYGLDSGAEGQFLVFDFGGGTLDCTVLNIDQECGTIDVVAISGNSNLGGIDFDREIVRFWDASNEDLLAARSAKESLSEVSEAVATLTSGREVRLSREELKTLSSKVLGKARKCIEKVLQDAACDPKDIDAVVLVGGSTRLLCVKEMIRDVFGRNPLDSINPDEVVAVGASRYAGFLVDPQDDEMVLVDVTPISLGIEIAGGNTKVLIPRNTVRPSSVEHVFSNYLDGQTRMTIKVLEGENLHASANHLLGKFSIDGIPPRPSGESKVNVKLEVTQNGTLVVSARTEDVEGEEISASMVVSSFGQREVKEVELSEEMQIAFEQLYEYIPGYPDLAEWMSAHPPSETSLVLYEKKISEMHARKSTEA